MSVVRPAPRLRVLTDRRPGDPTPLASVVNFGPVILPELASLGVTTIAQLERLGASEVLRRWVERYPERLNLHAAVALVATLEGASWTRISPAGKATARRIVAELRTEFLGGGCGG